MAENTVTNTKSDQASGVNTPDKNAQALSQINREFQEKSVMRRAKELDLPYIEIAKTPLNPDFQKLLDNEAAKKGKLIPFLSIAKDVHLAVVDPELSETKEIIKKLESDGYVIHLHLASESGIADALRIYDTSQQYTKMKIVKTVAEKSIQTYEKEIANMGELEKKLSVVSAEEALNLIDIGAVKAGVSDVHYEPDIKSVRVRFRIDGMLHNVLEMKPEIYKGILGQIKFKSNMKLNIVTVPQDGRYEFSVNEKNIDVRVSSIPTPYGESVVCRFLDQDEAVFSFEELGFDGYALSKLNQASAISHGMILITGPTGSGKTTTLYSIIDKMKKPENKIITLEDPVEYRVEGITQSQVDEKRGYSFATGLRSVLRHDPNVVMIGEIRDLTTAQTAAQAALTGHVLLSTLHTNSAVESIPRLINMGLQAFMIAPSLDTVIAQRLVRKVCPQCVTMEAITASESKEYQELFGTLKLANPTLALETPAKMPHVHGCDFCSHTGYKGRLVVCEAFVVNQGIKDLILNNAGTAVLVAAARKEGMLTMREDGYMKVARGLTTLEEVQRVTNIID